MNYIKRIRNNNISKEISEVYQEKYERKFIKTKLSLYIARYFFINVNVTWLSLNIIKMAVTILLLN